MSGTAGRSAPPEIADYKVATDQLYTAFSNILTEAAVSTREDLAGKIGMATEKMNKFGNTVEAVDLIVEIYGVDGFKKLYESLASSMPQFLGDSSTRVPPAFVPFKNKYFEVMGSPGSTGTTRPVRRFRYVNGELEDVPQ